MKHGRGLHSLQSVWAARRLPEGDTPCGETSEKLYTETQIIYQVETKPFCADPGLHDRIAHLHTLARNGEEGLQAFIDAHLPAVAYLEQHPSQAAFAKRMVLSITDAPQLGNLPDLGQLIRDVLYFPERDFNCKELLLNALSCVYSSAHKEGPSHTPKAHNPEAPNPEAQNTEACKNTCETHNPRAAGDFTLSLLLALLLGLYPTSVKFPPFHVRVALFRRVHSLLTCQDSQDPCQNPSQNLSQNPSQSPSPLHFCQEYPSLITLALMEYCAFVLKEYLPVEHSLLLNGKKEEVLLGNCCLHCDTFRQEVLLTGMEDWAAMEEHCAQVVERSRRTKTAKMISRPCPPHSRKKRPPIAPEVISYIIQLPRITPYDVHHAQGMHMASELRLLAKQGSDADHFSQAAEVQRTIQVWPLPANVLKIQIKALSARMRQCERSALSCPVMYACVQCIMCGSEKINHTRKNDRNQKRAFPARGQCKLQVEPHALLCTHCNNSTVVEVNALGRIVSLKGHQFYFAPCCCSVQPYAAHGDEFTSVHCRHAAPDRAPSRHLKRRCELCQNVAQQALSAVDHLTGESHTVHLCLRHAPHPDALKFVANWQQLQEQILKRDKPLFHHKRVKRRE